MERLTFRDDIGIVNKFVKRLCELNPTHCKKRDYEVKVISPENAPNEIPAIVRGEYFVVAKKRIKEINE